MLDLNELNLARLHQNSRACEAFEEEHNYG